MITAFFILVIPLIEYNEMEGGSFAAISYYIGLEIQALVKFYAQINLETFYLVIINSCSCQTKHEDNFNNERN